jgi:hypothetical protein
MADVSSSEIRAWAQSAGYAVGERGRLPSEVVTAFEKGRSRRSPGGSAEGAVKTRKAAAVKPVPAKPAGAKPVAVRAAAPKPLVAKPLAAKSLVTKPVAAKPAAPKPSAAKPLTRAAAAKPEAPTTSQHSPTPGMDARTVARLEELEKVVTALRSDVDRLSSALKSRPRLTSALRRG